MVSQSLCGVADLSQTHESDLPGSYVVIILSRGLLTNENKSRLVKKKIKKQKKTPSFSAIVSLRFNAGLITF